MNTLSTKVDFYLNNYNSDYSLMNNTFKDDLTSEDYVKFIINEYYKFRLDNIATVFYGDSKYYIFIMWANLDLSIDNLDAGKSINIPTIEYINTFFDKYKRINGVK